MHEEATVQGAPQVVLTRPPTSLPPDSLPASQPFRTVVLDDGVADDRARLLDAIVDAEGVYCHLTDRVDAEFFDAAPKLRVISNMAVGYDNIDVGEAERRRITVCNTPDVLTDTTAELTIALMLAASRRVVEADGYVRAGRWGEWSPDLMLGRDLAGATLGIVGPGRIGAAVARRCVAFDMRIAYCGRSVSQAFEREFDAVRWNLDQLFERSDVVSVHAPLLEETRGLVSGELMRRMKPTAILVNTARGALVDQEALIEVLEAGSIFAAALDVFENEPHVPERLRALHNVVLAPHIGSATVRTRRRMAETALENLTRYFGGVRPLSVVGTWFREGMPDQSPPAAGC